MIRAFRRSLAILPAVALAAACAHHQDLRKPAAQQDFGVQMAKMNLWREALFRFHRAVEINPNDAMAHNNLAVAYEANGDFEKARTEYIEALKLDRSNQYIQKNYSRFVEFLSRNRKREQREQPKSASAAPSNTTTAGASSQTATGGVPGQPAVTEPIKPPKTATAPPSDLPPQPAAPATPQPAPQPPPQPKPPGGGR